MDKIIYLLLSFVVVFVSCGRDEGTDEGELAAVAAKGYYDDLQKGKYEEFVDARYQPDSIPGSYRDQLIDNAKMFIGQQKEEHRGIKEVRIVNAKADTLHHTANVFLVFAYGDSTSEQVVVPMVKAKGVWKMR